MGKILVTVRISFQNGSWEWEEGRGDGVRGKGIVKKFREPVFMVLKKSQGSHQAQFSSVASP